MTLTFADISSHNTVTNWPTFLRSIDGAVVKATQGSSYIWSGAPAALAQTRAAGKLTGAYAFAGDLGSDGKVRCGDPVAEADYFLAHYDWRPGEVPINDFEPSILPADPDGWCAAFAGRVAARLGVVPWTYMNTSLARSGTWAKTRAAGSLLWAAQYGVNNGQPGPAPAVGSWGSCVAWQYTSNGAKPGISSPPLDLSFFYGDAAAWKAHGTPGDDMPTVAEFWLNDTINPVTGKHQAVIELLKDAVVRAEGARADAVALAGAVAKLQATVDKLAATPDVSAVDIAAALAAGYKINLVPPTA